MSVSSSAMDITNNEDLLIQILVRLPPKTLLTFKCVSKEWLSLISSSQFIVTHIRCRGTPALSGLFLNNDYMQTPEFHYVPLTHHNPSKVTSPPNLSYLGAPCIKILQSCNGLLLCSSAYQKNDPNFELKYLEDFMQTEDDVLLPDIWHVFPTISNSCSQIRIHYSGFRFYVCNPTTRQFKTLTFPFFEYRILALNLAFDPLHSPYFKIVCVLQKNQDSYILNIYNSETNSWNPSPIAFHAPMKICFCEPVFYSRAIHWYSSQQTSIYFDVDKECLNPLPMPWSLTLGTVQYFGESRGHLHLVISTASTLALDVFELEKDYSAWSLRYRINVDPIRGAFRDMCGMIGDDFLTSVLRIICAENEEESEVIFYMSDMNCTVSYNLSDRTLKKRMSLVPSHHGVAHLKHIHTYRDSFPFVESLSPI